MVIWGEQDTSYLELEGTSSAFGEESSKLSVGGQFAGGGVAGGGMTPQLPGPCRVKKGRGVRLVLRPGGRPLGSRSSVS